jgi:hypothetical protein
VVVPSLQSLSLDRPVHQAKLAAQVAEIDPEHFPELIVLKICQHKRQGGYKWESVLSLCLDSRSIESSLDPLRRNLDSLEGF